MWIGSQGFTLLKTPICLCLKKSTNNVSMKEKGQKCHEEEENGSESEEEEKEN